MIKKKFSIFYYGLDAMGRIVHVKIGFNGILRLLMNVYGPTQITEK